MTVYCIAGFCQSAVSLQRQCRHSPCTGSTKNVLQRKLQFIGRVTSSLHNFSKLFRRFVGINIIAFYGRCME